MQRSIFDRRKGCKTKIPLVGYSQPQYRLVAQNRLAKQLAAWLRKKRGDLTYQQFARKTGLSDSTLHRLEMGDENITLKTLEQLCDRFKCSVGEMFKD